MATLISLLKTDKGPARFRLYKKITTIGASHDNDICIQHQSMDDSHALVVYDGRQYTVNAAGKKSVLLVNGERARAAKLTHQDSITLGKVPLVFDQFDNLEDGGVDRRGVEVQNYRKLYEFSERLSGRHDLDDLLNTLIDAVIEITGADNGFLILRNEEDSLHFTAARNLNKESIDNADMYVSDSIIKRVMDSGKPLIVSDALSDEEFRNSRSVLSLKLSSVMCVPIRQAGELVGIIYVGNNRVVNQFSHETLQVLEIFAAQAALIIRNALLINELRRDKATLEERLETLKQGSMIGSCEALVQIYRKIDKIAKVDVPVLITGETGTGKELVAREVHSRSHRAKGPFIVINCGAIPETLLESELFGHKKGSFTGAMYDKPGKFKLAHGGTLFLDEIGDMPQALQVKILRALEERTITPVGGARPEEVDIRILAATNKNLEDEIRGERFRDDLFYRLNVISIHLPPLRERGDDVEVIARYFLQKFVAEFNRSTIQGLHPRTVRIMLRYGWPGNIRELQNRMKKAVILCERNLIEPEDLELSDSGGQDYVIKPLAVAREEWQSQYIMEALKRNEWNRTRTAQVLDVDPRTIFRYLERLDEEQKKTPSR